MEIINKKHPRIRSGKRSPVMMTVPNDRHLYFSNAAAEAYGLVPGLYIHFMNDGKHWSFFVNDDPDGFPMVTSAGNGGCGVSVFSRGLVKMFCAGTGHGVKSSFYIQDSGLKTNGCAIIDILTDKTIEQLTN